MEPVTGLILAGGQGSRMGGRDKGLVDYHGRPLIDHVIARIAPQVDELLISANRNLDEYGRRGHAVIRDGLPGFQGPLAGLFAGMQAARHGWVLAVPCDMPDLPGDLLARLFAATAGSPAVIAADSERNHPAVMLVQRSQSAALAAYLQAERRSVQGFLHGIGFSTAHFDAAQMRNLNTLEPGNSA